MAVFLNQYILYHHTYTFFAIPLIAVELDDERDDIAEWEMRAKYVWWAPDDEFLSWHGCEFQLEMFPIFPERTYVEYSLIFEEEEGFAIPDAKRSESIDDIDCLERDMITRESTFNLECTLGEILHIMDIREFSVHCLTKLGEPMSLDGEPCSLPMSTISDEILTTWIKKFDDIAPLGWATGGDRESWTVGVLDCWSAW